MPESNDAAHRRQIRELRGSIVRLTVSLRSGELSASELATGERTLLRLRAALAKAERRGKVGRPRKAEATAEQKPPTVEQANSADTDDLRWLGTRRSNMTTPKPVADTTLRPAPTPVVNKRAVEIAPTQSAPPALAKPRPIPPLTFAEPPAIRREIAPELVLQCMHFGVVPSGSAPQPYYGKPTITDPRLLSFIATGEIPGQRRSGNSL